MSAVQPDTTPGAGLGPDVGPAEMGEARTLGEAVHNWWVGVRSGELGSLPIILGLIIIAIVFQSQNSNFLTAPNFVNLIVQMAPIAVIGMGIVFVLLLGEIDLSVGYVSGVAGRVPAPLLNPDGNELPVLVVIPIALLCGASIGTLHGLLITKIGIPSFVVTLAGLLAWNGVVLLLIGDAGTVTVQNDLIIGFASDAVPSAAFNVLLVKIVELVGFWFGQYVGWGRVDERERYAPRMRAMVDALAADCLAGRIRPRTDTRIPLERIVEAFDVGAMRRGTGRVLVDMTD